MRQLLWGVMVWLALAGLVQAEPRLALVIGNSAYVAAPVLPGAVGDARQMAQALKLVGFEVTLIENANQDTMRTAFSTFDKRLRGAGPDATGLVFYAGQGVQSLGQNYLLPVDVQLTRASDLSLVAVDAQALLQQMANAGARTNLVILDASRANPFPGVADLGDGLAEMSVPPGVFAAYAAQPDTVSVAISGARSAYASALAARLTGPEASFDALFGDVRVAVLQATGGQQSPWEASGLTGEFNLGSGNTAGNPAALDDDTQWASASLARDPVQIMVFLSTYPKSAHAADARALLKEVMQSAVTAQAGPAPAVSAAEVPAAETPAAETPVAEAPAASAATDEIPATMAVAIAAEAVTFSGPLTEGDAAIKGQSIETLIATGPLFTPIEGLPNEAWQGQHCVACHKWTKPALCDQAKFYVKEATPSALVGQHPLGGAFKLTLKAWGAADCP